MNQFKTFLHTHPHLVSFLATTLTLGLTDFIGVLVNQQALVLETLKPQIGVIVLRSVLKALTIQIAPTSVSTTTTTTSTDQTVDVVKQ